MNRVNVGWNLFTTKCINDQESEPVTVEPVVIEKCLGHKMPRIMATYNKNEMQSQRKEASDQWADFVEDLLQENVVPIS